MTRPEARTRGAARARIGAAVALAAILVSLWLADGGPPPQERRLAGTAGDEPLAGGEQMTLDEAKSVFPAAIPLPATSADNDETIEELWVALGKNAETYVTYRSGLIVIVDPAESFDLTLEEWYDRQTKDGVPSSLENLGGAEAYIVEPATTDSGFDTGSVKMFVQDAVVTVIGNGTYDGSQLREIATSLIHRAASDAA